VIDGGKARCDVGGTHSPAKRESDVNHNCRM
jgi:hypothetical protein